MTIIKNNWIQYNYGYKSWEYLTSQPHLTILKEKGKAYKQAAQIPAAERRAMAAAADPTTTTIMTMNSLFDSTDTVPQCLVKFSELV